MGDLGEKLNSPINSTLVYSSPILTAQSSAVGLLFHSLFCSFFPFFSGQLVSALSLPSELLHRLFTELSVLIFHLILLSSSFAQAVPCGWFLLVSHGGACSWEEAWSWGSNKQPEGGNLAHSLLLTHR